MAKEKDATKKTRSIVLPLDPVFRIPQEMSVDEQFLVNRALSKTEAFRNDRLQWMERRAEWYLGWDDYVSPIRKGLYEGESNYHIPLTETQLTAMHATIIASVFFSDTPFFIDPNEDLDIARVRKIEAWMKYVVTRLANNHRGIYTAIDDWATDLCVDGVGILSRDWSVRTSRYLDIEKNEEYFQLAKKLATAFEDDLAEEEFYAEARKIQRAPYREVFKVGTVFDGPVIQAKPVENILFKGMVPDATDLDLHETVIEVCWLSKNDLLTFRDQGFMDDEAVEKIIAYQRDKYGSTMHSARDVKGRYQDILTGNRVMNATHEEDSFEFYKVFDNVALDNSNKMAMTDRVVYYVHPATQTLASWTYLDRVSGNKKLPLHMAHLYRRPRRTIGRGIVETMFPHNEITDILVNQAVNAGMLANNPMFAYRADGTFDPKEFRAEPGLGLKTDDPMNDLRLLTFNVNPMWAASLIQMIEGKAQQMTALSSERFGQVGMRVGATRSNAGLQTMIAMGDKLLNVVFKRIGDCLGPFFSGMYADSIMRMPEQKRIPIVGMDGQPLTDDEGNIIRTDVTREELVKNAHFIFTATAANMNGEQRKAEAMEFFQIMTQKIFTATNVVGVQQVFNLANLICEAFRIPQKDRFVSQDFVGSVFVSYDVEIASIRQGIMPPIGLNDPEHEQKIEKMQALLDSDIAASEIETGKVHASAPALLKIAIQKHQEYFDVQAQAQALKNPTGNNQLTMSGNTGNVPQPNGQRPTTMEQPAAGAAEAAPEMPPEGMMQ